MLNLYQRRVAYVIVWLLCLAWAALGLVGIITAYTTPTGTDGTGGFLFLLSIVGVGLVLVALAALVAGVAIVRILNAGTLRWRTLLALVGSMSVVSVWVGLLLAPSIPTLGTLLVLQAVLLLALAAVVRPTPVASQ
ncbi:hypothetical protein GCM10011376_37210 [Nocardioides flavus (ex Wang et al. 2016)]|uniref:Integral membrane protein n=1 Tax=Nocardioides flavus (ex Wang et al. 2016) TaxID=2058780 RepID=A0ABQ3HR10_9ACTN|nr:hypothetical protein [Nocardioides flavus (ex Wang et al. 2016)]GHE19111.1 hypothetical protein GCM10011376_37210 [Nocardioides flavus (ex Wang et al. 2016)]